jgi:hypothetical protein
MANFNKYCLNCTRKTPHEESENKIFCYCDFCKIITENPYFEPLEIIEPLKYGR